MSYADLSIHLYKTKHGNAQSYIFYQKLELNNEGPNCKSPQGNEIQS